MRKNLLNRIARLWITSGILAISFILVFVAPVSRVKDLFLGLVLAVLAGLLFEQGAKLYEVYKALKPQKIKAWIR